MWDACRKAGWLARRLAWLLRRRLLAHRPGQGEMLLHGGLVKLCWDNPYGFWSSASFQALMTNDGLKTFILRLQWLVLVCV